MAPQLSLAEGRRCGGTQQRWGMGCARLESLLAFKVPQTKENHPADPERFQVQTWSGRSRGLETWLLWRSFQKVGWDGLQQAAIGAMQS